MRRSYENPVLEIARGPGRIVAQLALLSAGFAALALMAAATVWLVYRSNENFSWVTHSLDVQNRLTQLQLSVRRAESGQRGFLLTNDPTYLAVYQESAAMIGPRLAELTDLVADNPDQSARTKALAEVVEKKRAEMAAINDLQQQGRTSEALAIVRDPAGQDLMGRFVEISTAFRGVENAILADRTERTRVTSQWLLATTLLGAIAIILLAGISMLLIRRSTARLVQAQAELAEMNANLEEKVEQRTADLKEANDELQRFAYIVSHDLRSPLVNIMGFTGELDAIRRDLLEQNGGSEAPADPKQQSILVDFDEALGFIKSSISKMDRLIRAILDLSRAGRRDFRPEALDLNAILNTIRDALAHQSQEVGATIDIGPLPVIESDRLAVEQIFSNLLDNAIKYLRPDQPGRISVTAGERIGFAVIRVEDNGRGIDEADRERVFELFRRAGAQDRPGEGIGLAHVRALVRRLGGSIRLDSRPREGSTFTVILPKRWKS